MTDLAWRRIVSMVGNKQTQFIIGLFKEEEVVASSELISLESRDNGGKMVGGFKRTGGLEDILKHRKVVSKLFKEVGF